MPALDTAPSTQRARGVPGRHVAHVMQLPPPPITPIVGYGLGYAGFWRRVLAWLIDSILLFAVQLALTAGVLLIVPPSDLPQFLNSPLLIPQSSPWLLDLEVLLLVYPVLGAITWAYYAIMESSPAQGTVGKIALGLTVTNTRGDPVGFLRASFRYWFRTFSTLILMVGWLMVAFTPRKQALHDMLAGTFVLRRVAILASPSGDGPELAEYWDGLRWMPASAALEKRVEWQ
jgi:uncharacterized RDD family membrane protein YckC